MSIEDILSDNRSLKWDYTALSKISQAFAVKEFIFIFYGSSRDKNSRQVARALNGYIEAFNPDDTGLRKEKDEVHCVNRSCQVIYIPNELNYEDFQSFYKNNIEYGWMYPDFPQEDDFDTAGGDAKPSAS